MPFAGDLPDNNFAAYKAEMVRWKCKWQNVTEKPSTLIDTLKHAKSELYPNIHRAKGSFDYACNLSYHRKVF